MNPIILDERLSAAAKMAREALEGQEQPKGAVSDATMAF